jgi:hypothetical protein
MSPKTNGFINDTTVNLIRLQLAVAHQTVKVNFTGHDVMRWLVPPEHLEILTAAWPLLKRADRTSFRGDIIFCDPVMLTPVRCSLYVNCNKLEIVVPGDHILRSDRAPGAVTDVLAALYRLSVEWIAVYDVISWLDEYATVGAAQYYFPTLTSLLPYTHAIHNCGGQRFNEPTRPVGPMIPKFRSAAMTVAAALLCPLEVPNRELVTVSFTTTRPPIMFGVV